MEDLDSLYGGLGLLLELEVLHRGLNYILKKVKKYFD
jgi:hypothetical protein